MIPKVISQQIHTGEFLIKTIPFFVDAKLRNDSLPPEQPDNWSFIISSEFNATESQIPGNYEKIENGVKVSGYHLGTSEGRGPYISFSEYKEPLPEKVNIWKIIENKEDEMKLF